MGLFSVIFNVKKIQQNLLEEIQKIKSLAEKKGAELLHASTKNPNAALIYNDKAIAILIIKEKSDHFLITPYIIDVKKWEWAESEGFSRDQIWEDEKLQNMIFFPTVRKEMYKHLGISV